MENNIEHLSIRQKVGQLFVLAYSGKDTQYAKELINQYLIGGFYITDDNAHSLVEAKALSETLQQENLNNQAPAPLLLSVDQEGAWGILAQHTDLGPGNLGLGKANDPQLTQTMYQVYGQQMQAIGYNSLLSPCVDINANPDNPIIGLRSFGETVEKVSSHASAAVRGVNETGNFSCAKHFPGHGDTDSDSHRELPIVDKPLSQLMEQDLKPFEASINAGVNMMMTSHIMYPQIDPQNPATLSYEILTTLLKKQMGFDGIIITDSMNMWAMRKNYSPVESAIKALKAGAHLIMLSEEHYENETTDYKVLQKQTIEGVIAAVESGELNESFIDETLKHVINNKQKMKQLEPKLSANRCKAASETAAINAIDCLNGNISEFIRGFSGQEPLAISVMANPSGYESLVNSRGIGPNDPVAAAEAFKTALQDENITCKEYSYEQLLQQEERQSIFVITEDYPLAGESFDTQAQLKKVNQLAQIHDVFVIAFRSDYELANMPNIKGYVCAYSSRQVSARAMVEKYFK